MTAARSAADRVREFVRGGGTGDTGLDHDLMLLASEVLAPSNRVRHHHVTLTTEQCERRIAALVREVGLAESVLRERANLHLLDARETAALQVIDELRYLIGGRR